jgi:hypothetical protein
MSSSIKYTDAILDKKLLVSQKQLSSIGISYPFRYFFKFLKPPSIGHKIAFICPGDGESKCSKTLLNFYQTIWHHILEDIIPHTTKRFSQEFSALPFIKSFRYFKVQI